MRYGALRTLTNVCSRRTALIPVLFLLAGCAAAPAVDENDDAWWVADGFDIEVDAIGFLQPTSIAAVPNPGSDPNEPVYFVGEAAGRISVVTNDRSVHTFADGILGYEGSTWRTEDGEIGMKGLCLSAERGYVFATYTMADSTGRRMLGIVRFESEPDQFGLKPRDVVHLRELFRDDFLSTRHHHVGECEVVGEHVYIGVGDGGIVEEAQDTTSSFGKVLRMTLDGAPAGIHAEAAGRMRTPAYYVWARGLRNPFGLAWAGSSLLTADNGIYIDRLLALEGGANYGWDGTDASIGFRADVVLSPSIGAAQTDYRTAGDTAAFEEGTLYVAGYGAPPEKQPVVLGIPFDAGSRSFSAPPSYVVRGTRGNETSIVALAASADGLLFAPYSDVPGRTTPVIRVRRRAFPQADGPNTTPDPVAVIERRGCLGCHRFQGAGVDFAPALDPEMLVPRLHARLHAASYESRLRSESGRTTAYAELASVEGRDRIEAWLVHFLQDPQFEDPSIPMAGMNLEPEEAAAIAQLLSEPPPILRTRLEQFAMAALPNLRYRHLAVAATIGWLVGVVMLGLVVWARRRGKSKVDRGRET